MRNWDWASLPNDFLFLEELPRDNLLPGIRQTENPLPGKE